MLPCCWIAAIAALLAGFGISFADLKLGLVVGLSTLASILILKKIKKNQSKSCCSKKI